MYRWIGLALVVIGAPGVMNTALAQMHEHDTHRQETVAGATDDGRSVVKLPGAMRSHMLANMRDHLLALQEIQDALARRQYDMAGDIAERRLGMTSLRMHGAHELATFMPDAMQAIGTEMHRAASRFALAAKDAAATGDVAPTLEAMARVTQQCVTCHASYRLQ